jgi:hypothetical protein
MSAPDQQANKPGDNVDEDERRKVRVSTGGTADRYFCPHSCMTEQQSSSGLSLLLPTSSTPLFLTPSPPPHRPSARRARSTLRRFWPRARSRQRPSPRSRGGRASPSHPSRVRAPSSPPLLPSSSPPRPPPQASMHAPLIWLTSKHYFFDAPRSVSFFRFPIHSPLLNTLSLSTPLIK